MKATGIVRRFDDLGRIAIPREIRRQLEIKEGQGMEIFTDRDGAIILKNTFRQRKRGITDEPDPKEKQYHLQFDMDTQRVDMPIRWATMYPRDAVFRMRPHGSGKIPKFRSTDRVHRLGR